jgi:hypothetical protein
MAKKMRVVPLGSPIKPIRMPVQETVLEDSLVPEPLRFHGEQEELLFQIEKRFLEVANLDGTLSYVITREDNMQVETNKEKSDEHGEVFTPLWLVDKMHDRITPHSWKRADLTTHDLCSGYGQFTVRMLRRRYKYMGETLDIPKVLSEYHLFSEIQPGSCFRLLYIFGQQIRLLIGDVTKMGELPDSAEKGIWVYTDKWKDKTELVLSLFNKYISEPGTIMERVGAFEGAYNRFKSLCMKKEK